MFASLRKIKEEHADWTIIPSHGEIIQDVPADVDSIVYSYLNKSTVALEYLRARATACRTETSAEGKSGSELSQAKDEIDDGHQPQERTVRQVAKAIYRMEDHPEDEEVFFSYKMLITKTFSLLEYLHDEGFVRRIDRNSHAPRFLNVNRWNRRNKNLRERQFQNSSDTELCAQRSPEREGVRTDRIPGSSG